MSSIASRNELTREDIQQRINELGKWFHNMNLGGVQTAPDHFLGDYPGDKFRRFEPALPKDLKGKTVLDIGCNAGFYSIEMKRRGADRVLGIDFSDTYLDQARFAAQVTGHDIEFRKCSVYDVGKLGEKFDVVIFMGVLYHLRHPLLALDLIHDHVCKDLLIFQSMQRGSAEVSNVEEDYPFSQTDIFENPDFPHMYFIENRYSGDQTNWWIPNMACVEGMLRSSGFEIESHPEQEVYICRWRDIPEPVDGPRSVYPARGDAR